MGYPPFYSDEPLTTCRKIVNWRMFLRIPDEARLSPAARDLIARLMCDVDDRVGTRGGVEEIKVRAKHTHGVARDAVWCGSARYDVRSWLAPTPAEA